MVPGATQHAFAPLFDDVDVSRGQASIQSRTLPGRPSFSIENSKGASPLGIVRRTQAWRSPSPSPDRLPDAFGSNAGSTATSVVFRLSPPEPTLVRPMTDKPKEGIVCPLFILQVSRTIFTIVRRQSQSHLKILGTSDTSSIALPESI